MKRNRYFIHATAACTLAAFGSAGHAQPVLTAANGPVPGGTIPMAELAGVPSLCNGPGCVWDFTAVATPNIHQVQLVAPATAPGGGSFPMATVAALATGNPNVNFMRLETGYLRTVGVYNGQVVQYTDPLDVLVYPCTYQTTWTDSYAYPGTQGTRTYTADGYGTLIGPAGTLDNVLKIHSGYATLDTVAGGTHFTATMDENAFWHPDIPWPVATTYWSRVYTNGQLTQEQRVGSVIDQFPIGVEEPAGTGSGALVYPNPAGDLAWVLLEGAWQGPVTVSIHDATGRLVRTQQLFVEEGRAPLHLTGLNTGMYHAELRSGTRSAVLRFKYGHR
jgi:hypothetical protein